MDLLKELKGCRTIGITGHLRPDGDCIGSTMAVYLYLKKNMPDAAITLFLEEAAPEFNCIKDIDCINSSFASTIEVFDAFVGLDSSSKDRYGDAESLFDKAKKKIVIDHHATNDGFGDVCLVDPMAGSTCELLMECMDEELIDEDIALPLYIGIIHDTGVLQYSCTTPKTLRKVAKLLEFDIDFSTIIRETFYERTRIQNEMLGRSLMESMLIDNGKIIVSKVDLKIMKFYSATAHDFEGIVSQMLNTKGVEVAVFMYELEPMVYKVSLRSKGKVDVAKIAKFYNGGGHERAAGCTLSGTFHDCINNISDSIHIQISETKIDW